MRLVSPFGRLSRGVAGVVGGAIVCNTPGSPTGCVEQLGAVLDVLPHALRLLHEEPTAHVMFELVVEIEPPTRPSLVHARHQIGVLGKVADAYLVPDNHLGRATVSSLAVAHEVAHDGRAGHRLPQLARPQRPRLPARPADRGGLRRRRVPARLRRPPGRRAALRRRVGPADDRGDPHVRRDRRVRRLPAVPGRRHDPPAARRRRSRPTPTSSSPRSATTTRRWRGGATPWPSTGRCTPACMVVASASMARKLATESEQLAVPAWLVDAVDADPAAGVDAACTLIERVRDHGGFAGVHLVAVSRYREVAARLEAAAAVERAGGERSNRVTGTAVGHPDSVRRRVADRAAEGLARAGHARAVRGRRPDRGAVVGRGLQGDHRRPARRRGPHPATAGDPGLRGRGAVRRGHHRPRLDRGDEQRGRQPRRAAVLQGDQQPDPDGGGRRRRLRDHVGVRAARRRPGVVGVPRAHPPLLREARRPRRRPAVLRRQRGQGARHRRLRRGDHRDRPGPARRRV